MFSEIFCKIHGKAPVLGFLKNSLEAFSSEHLWMVTSDLYKYLKIWPSHTAYLSIFSPNARKCGTNADENKSELGHFYTV